MSELDINDIRHALKVARDSGMRQVTLRAGATRFKAVISEEGMEMAEEVLESEPAPTTQEVNSKSVGYFQFDEKELAKGKELVSGEKMGSIVALGIANDMVAPISGKIEEVLIKNGAPVEFGQALLKVKVDQ